MLKLRVCVRCHALATDTRQASCLRTTFSQVKNALYGKDTSEDDPQLKRIYTHSSNPGKTFLISLGFEQVKENKKNVLRLKKDFQHIELEDTYVAVYALCV